MTMKSKAKFWVGLIGAIASSLTFAFAADSTPGKLIGAVIALAGAIGVYLTPNTPTPAAGVTGQYVGK